MHWTPTTRAYRWYQKEGGGVREDDEGLEIDYNQEPFPLTKKSLLDAAGSGREKDDNTCSEVDAQDIEVVLTQT